MVSWKSESVNVRCGLTKCWSCGELYDPTYGKCPCKRKRKPNNFYVSTFALGIVLFLSAMCTVNAGAQVGPIVVPTPTRMPAPPVFANSVYLPLIVR